MVSTPVQALNLLEFQRASKAPVVVVLVTDAERPDQTARQTQNVLDALESISLVTLGGWQEGHRSPAFDASAYLKEFDEYVRGVAGEEITLVLGDYAHTFGWEFARRFGVRPEQVVVLADGKAMLEIDRTELPQGTPGNDVFNWAVRWDHVPYRRTTFFTSYAKQIRTGRADTVLDNEWLYAREQYRCLPIDDTLTVVIGSPYDAPWGGVSLEEDIAITKRVVAVAKGLAPRRPIYVPHRHDRGPKLEALSAVCDVRSFDVPFELAPPKLGFLPGHFVGTTSTSLFNMLQLAEATVDVTAVIPPDEFFPPEVNATTDRFLKALDEHRSDRLLISDHRAELKQDWLT